MRRSRTILAASAIMVLGLTLAGCSAAEEPEKTTKPAPTTSETAPSEAESTETPSTGGDTATDGELSPGTVSGAGWHSYENINYDDAKAILAVQIDSITPASQAFTDELVAKSANLVDYDLVLVKYKQKFISGDVMDFNADYTNFGVGQSSDQRVLQSVSLIGYDDCETQSFPKDWSTSGEILDQCLLAAVPKGGATTVDSLVYQASDTPFSKYDGKPAFIKL